MEFTERLESIRALLVDRLWDWLYLLPLLLIALLVVVIFWHIAKWISGSGRLFRLVSKNVFMQDLARQVVRTAIVIVGVLLALEILDATALVGAVLGAAGVVGLAVGFAFRDLVENYIASILLSIRQPFAPNDHVRIGDVEGKVARLTSRATILITFDGNHVRIPNATVYKGMITNYSRKPERRFKFEVGVGTNVDLSAAQDLAVKTLADIEGVLENPSPASSIKSLGDSNVTLTILGWVNQQSSSYGKTRSEAIRQTKEAFDRAGIDMPEPIQRIRMESQSTADTADDKSIWNRLGEGSSAPRSQGKTRDTAPEFHLEEDIRRERESDPDLLAADAPRE